MLTQVRKKQEPTFPPPFLLMVKKEVKSKNFFSALISGGLKRNVSLKNYSHLKIGGRASYFFKASKIDDLILTLNWWLNSFPQKPIFVLGEGTNVLFKGDFFDGLVIKMDLKKLDYLGKGLVFAEAGVLMRRLVSFCFQKKLAGSEWAAGLPGTLGGAVYGNAGCFGKEIKDVVEGVLTLERRGKEFVLSLRRNKECLFKYRSSIFKKNQKKGEFLLIVGVLLKLQPVKDIKPFKEKASFILRYRRQKHPLDLPTLGSTFKNIPLSRLPSSLINKFQEKIKNDPFLVLPVAVLLEKAGLKGKKKGGAQFSLKHPNFIVNLGKATAKDVLQLIALAKKKVWKKFQVKIEEEIEIV